MGNPDELAPLGKDAPLGAVTTGFAWYDAKMKQLHPELAGWVQKYMKWSKGKEPKLGSSWGYATAYIIAEAIKRAGSTDHKRIIGVLDEGYKMHFPWGTVVMRGCDHQALPPQWTGIVKLNAKGQPVMGDVEELQGKDIAHSCEEVKQLRAAAHRK